MQLYIDISGISAVHREKYSPTLLYVNSLYFSCLFFFIIIFCSYLSKKKVITIMDFIYYYSFHLKKDDVVLDDLMINR